jgi:methionine synthase II (cobalamin-independent)
LKETREQLRVAKELKKENEHWKQTNLKAVELITKLQNENKRLIELLHNSDISPDATISNL